MAAEARTRRARGWLLTGLSGLLSAIGLSLGQGSFVAVLAVASAIVAGVGLHRFGRSGARPST